MNLLRSRMEQSEIHYRSNMQLALDMTTEKLRRQLAEELYNTSLLMLAASFVMLTARLLHC